MKTIIAKSVLCLALCLAPSAALAGAPVRVDILYMNHGPMQPVIRDVRAVLESRAGAIEAAWHDFETPDGREFMKRQGINEHVPMLIFIDGSPTRTLGGREVTFRGFPDGAGPYQFRGKWTIDDLKAALDQRAAGK